MSLFGNGRSQGAVGLFLGKTVLSRLSRCFKTSGRYGDDLPTCPVLARFLGLDWPMSGNRFRNGLLALVSLLWCKHVAP